jgi:hypothetical protein
MTDDRVLLFAERSRDRGGGVQRRNIFASLIVVMSTVLFFVRVNQVLVRLWARHQSSVFSRLLSEVSDDGPPGTGDGRRSADV